MSGMTIFWLIFTVVTAVLEGLTVTVAAIEGVKLMVQKN